MKTTQKTQKNTTFPKKIISELRLDPPTHFRVFLGFFNFFYLKVKKLQKIREKLGLFRPHQLVRGKNWNIHLNPLKKLVVEIIAFSSTLASLETYSG